MRPTTTRSPFIRTGAVALALALALSGCSTASDEAEPTTSAPSSTSAQLPAPVIVDAGETSAQAAVGETIVFNQADPANTTISTDNPAVLQLTQGSDDGSAQFNPSAVALSAGVAVVTIEAADGTTSQVTVTVR
jgi:ABC-type Fe3+-hydroxamate transport system substrate-binding protein